MWYNCTHTNFLFVILLHLYIILNNISDGKELRNILTKKGSLEWIDSFNTSSISNNSYCHLCCINIRTKTVGKRCGLHTLCKYQKDKIGSNCKGYISIGFTKIEKDTILDAHNTLRNYVASGKEVKGKSGPQPSASNMRSLQWNDELELSAERWAAQCLYSNDICRDSSRFPVGQNIGRGNFATNNLLTFIDSWYEEVYFYNSTDVSRFKFDDSESPSSTRYTQMMWAETYLLGCARAVFQSYMGAEVSYTEHMFCNYGPSGNIPHQPVYLTGSPCSACQEGTCCTIDYPALCEVDLINKNTVEKSIRNSTMENTGIQIKSCLFYYMFIIYKITNV